MNNFIKITFSFFLIVLVASCGGGGSSSGGGSGSVSYSVSPTEGITCNGQDRRSDTTNVVQCVWTCAINTITNGDNNGVTGFWAVTFGRDRNGLWELRTEAVRECPM